MKLLDLFCGVGGASEGYRRAGFTDITGVDIRKQPNYPFDFIQEDAISYLADHGDEYDVIHASPPCQGYSHGVRSEESKNTPRMIEVTRHAIPTGKWSIIENVIGAKENLIKPIVLDGRMFDRPVARKRCFEVKFPVVVPPLKHKTTVQQFADSIGRDRREVGVTGHARSVHTKALWRTIMDIHWAQTCRELREAIYPAFTQYLGEQLLLHLRQKSPQTT